MSAALKLPSRKKNIWPTDGDQRILLPNFGWREYERLLDVFGDRHIFITYDRGNLEIMAPSYLHEYFGECVHVFIKMLIQVLRLTAKSAGSTTFRKKDLDRGLEPDKCYYFGNAPSIKGRSEIDLSRDPAPDLAIEIDVTSSSLDRMGIYAALNVPEVWRYDGATLRVYVLGADGQYALSDRSLNLPFLPLAALPDLWSNASDMQDFEQMEFFRNWIETRILPTWKNTSSNRSRGTKPSTRRKRR